MIHYEQQSKFLNRQIGATIGCLIPMFNEEDRILEVLKIIDKFSLFNQIVIVNDCSTDDGLGQVKEFIAGKEKYKLVDLEENLGKTGAVLQGMDKIGTDMVCLIDADLTGFKHEFIYKMIYYLLNNEFDMTILDREGDRVGPLGWTQSWLARFYGGERAFWKVDFDKVEFGEQGNYALEQVLNLYYVQNQLKVRTIFCEGLYGAFQFKKKGLLQGLNVYLKMFEEIYKASDIKGFYMQVENIVEDRIEPLYKYLEKTKRKKMALGAIFVAGLAASTASFYWLNAKRVVSKLQTTKR